MNCLDRSSAIQTTLGFTSLSILAVWLFGGLIGGFWRGDDPAILAHAIASPSLAAFSDPVDWRRLSPSNLTPWITLSFKVDLAISGLTPSTFYAHQILSLIALIGVSLLWLRRWVSPLVASSSIALFLVGAPTGAVVEALMTRHYLEGLLSSTFALFAFDCFMKAWRSRKTRIAICWYALVAIAYGVAATAKEVYVPLPLLICVLPGLGDWRQRLIKVAPLFVLLGGYVLWRTFMLGHLAGGYSDFDILLSLGTLLEFMRSLLRFPGHLWGNAWPLPILLLGWLTIKTCRSEANRWMILLSVGFLLLGPLLPLVKFPGFHGPDRYLFLLWFGLCVLIAIGVQNASKSSRDRWILAGLSAVCFFLPTIFNAIQQERSREIYAQQFEVQGRFLWDGDSELAYLPTPMLEGTFWYVTELCTLRPMERGPCPRALIQGVDHQVPGSEVMKFTLDQMRPVKPEEVLQFLTVDKSAPLQAKVELRAGIVEWQFGPESSGKYFIASPRLGRYPISKTGALRTAERKFKFVLLYEEPDGTVRASTWLEVVEDLPLEWKRPS